MVDIKTAILQMEAKLQELRERTKLLRSDNEVLRNRLEGERQLLDERRNQQLVRGSELSQKTSELEKREREAYTTHAFLNRQLDDMHRQATEYIKERTQYQASIPREYQTARDNKRDSILETDAVQGQPTTQPSTRHNRTIHPNTYRTGLARTKSFSLKKRDYFECKGRFSNLRMLDTLKLCEVYWPDWDPESKLRAENDRYQISGDVWDKTEDVPTPTNGRCVAKVVLVGASSDEELHPYFRMQLIAAAFGGDLNEVVCYGGAHDPELDGQDATSDSVLRCTINRHLKRTAGTELPASASLLRFVSFTYAATDGGIDEHVYFICDMSKSTEPLVLKQLVRRQVIEKEVEVEKTIEEEVEIEEPQDETKKDEEKKDEEKKDGENNDNDEAKVEGEDKSEGAQEKKMVTKTIQKTVKVKEKRREEHETPGVSACAVPFLPLLGIGRDQYAAATSAEFKAVAHCIDEMMQQRYGEKLVRVLTEISEKKRKREDSAQVQEKEEPAGLSAVTKRRKMVKKVTDNAMLDVFRFFDRPTPTADQRSEELSQLQLRHVLLCTKVPGMSLRKLNNLLAAIDLARNEHVRYPELATDKESHTEETVDSSSTSNASLFPSFH